MKVLQQITMYEPSERSIVFQDTYPVPYLHWHKEMQMVWVRAGHGTVIIGNYIRSFRPGQIFIVGANQPHLFKADNGKQRSVHVVCLYVDHHRVFNGIDDKIPELTYLADFLKMADNGLMIPDRFVDFVGENILKVKEAIGFDRFIKFLELMNELIKIGSWSEWKPLSAVLTNYSVEVSDRLDQIYRFTLAHYMDDISLEDVSALACMTPNAFCSYFKKYTRKTYFAFLNDLRISEACKKLLHGHYSTISTVAYACGFINPVTFNRVFRKAMGMTPTEYVERFQIKNRTIQPFSDEAFS